MILYIAIAIVAIIAYVFLFASNGKVKGLRNKYVLITGCDSGFGRLAMEQLDKKGVNVFACCLLQKSVDEIRQSTNHCIPFTMNVTDTEDVQKGVQFVKQKLPANQGLWGIVNNAGVIGCGYAEWLTKKDYEKVINVNLLGVIDVTIQFLGLVIKEKGRVVNVASMLGRRHDIIASSYIASKFGVLGFADSLRMEMRPFGVSVHNLCPGYYQTKLVNSTSEVLQGLIDRLDEEVKSRYTEEHMNELKEACDIGYSLSNPDLSLVTNAIEDALLSLRPKNYYFIGVDAFLVRYISLLPIDFGDWLYRLIFQFPTLKPSK